MGVEPLRHTLINRWREIESDVLPALEMLSDIGKQLVFEQAFAATLWDFPTNRKAQKDLRALREKIASQSRKLADLLRQATEVSEPHGMTTGVPPLWNSLDRAAQRWPTWYSVMKAHGHLHDFLRVAKDQSRPGPTWSDLLEELATGIEEDDIESFIDPIIENRKQSADITRALQYFLSFSIYHPDIPPQFMLPDQAIATLIGVLFDIEVSPLAVKQVRYRSRSR